MKKIIGVTSFVALSLATLFFASNAQAVGSVDQQVNYTLGWYSCFGNTSNKGQTFTPSTSGNLDRISAVLAKDGSPGTITMYVYASSGGYPTGSVLGSASVPDSSFSSRGSGTPTSTNFDFSSPIAVTAGTQYIFYFDAPSAISSMGFPMTINDYCWYNEQNVLTSETSATKSSGSWGSLSNNDFDFATYISLAASASASASSSSSASASASAIPSGSATSASLATTGSSPVPLLTAAMLVSAGAVVAAVSFVIRRKRS